MSTKKANKQADNKVDTVNLISGLLTVSLIVTAVVGII